MINFNHYCIRTNIPEIRRYLPYQSFVEDKNPFMWVFGTEISEKAIYLCIKSIKYVIAAPELYMAA